MGLLDKVESTNTEAKKATPVVAKEAKPVPKKEKKPTKETKPKEKKPRPQGLSDEFEIAPKLSRVISWWVNFVANFAILIGALVMNVLTGGGSGGFENTLLFIIGFLVILFNAIFLPINTGRNLGQYTSSTRYIRGDGSKPLFLHSLFVNNIGLMSLIGFIMVFTQAGKISGGGSSPVIFTSVGAVLMILWIVNWQFTRNSDLNQGLFDLLFGAYLVRYVPEEQATSGFRARLESMSQFGEKYAQRVEDRARAREEKAAAKASEREENAEEAEESEEKPEE